MVQVMITSRLAQGRAGGPLIHIHAIERHVHGNGIFIRVYGEMQIAAQEFVEARDLKLNTIQVLLLTPEFGGHARGLIVSNYIMNKGQYDNLASVDIFTDAGAEVVAGNGNATANGSVWMNFMALGE